MTSYASSGHSLAEQDSRRRRPITTPREAVAPLYLFLSLLLGGSAQGVWGNMVLELLGLTLIAWAALAGAGGKLRADARQLLVMALIAVAIVALQLIPLPANVWQHLGGRAAIASGYGLLGIPIPAFTLSLTPYRSLDSLLGLIPPLGIFCAMVRLRAYRPELLAAALLAGVMAGILLGALQVSSADPFTSPWYLYADSNFESATGFFANANHMATLLLVSLPFLAALLAVARTLPAQRYGAALVSVAAAALVILIGLLLNKSLAGYGLALPVILGSSLIVLPRNSRLRLWAMVLGGLLLAAAVAALSTSSIQGEEIGKSATASVESRQAILSTSARALRDFMPFGSGLGSFQQVYPLYEDPGQVTPVYVVHVHNDYVELALETGVAGILLVAAFLLWWTVAVWRVWRAGGGSVFARAASVASGAILIHSLVDFPLREVAIGTFFGMCMALLVENPAADRSGVNARARRDVVIR